MGKGVRGRMVSDAASSGREVAEIASGYIRNFTDPAFRLA